MLFRSATREDSRRACESPWDRHLRDHVLTEHRRQILDIAGPQEKHPWDVYKQALAVRERQTLPAVGAAVDRRAFDQTLQVYTDDRVRALMCFGCARICLDTGGPRSHIEYKRGGWLLALPTGSLKKNFSKAEFEKRYQQLGSPLASRGREQRNPDFTHWHLSWHPDVLREAGKQLDAKAVLNPDVVEMGSTSLLCCPEDHRCLLGCVPRKLCPLP